MTKRRPDARVPPDARLPNPKRPRRQTLEVFQILAEEGLGGPEGWFSVPWRRGSALVTGMLRRIYLEMRLFATQTKEEHDAERVLLMNWFDSSAEYSACEEAKSGLMTSQAPQYRVELLATALRARQLDIARSDGGGHAYNALLLNRWAAFGVIDADVAYIVLNSRAHDAIGLDSRYRRAFDEAWKARCYQAAYALPYLEKP